MFDEDTLSITEYPSDVSNLLQLGDETWENIYAMGTSFTDIAISSNAWVPDGIPGDKQCIEMWDFWPLVLWPPPTADIRCMGTIHDIWQSFPFPPSLSLFSHREIDAQRKRPVNF